MTETRAQRARAAKMTPAEKATASIINGEFDEDLPLLVNALQSRVLTGAVSLNWRVDLDDLHVTEEDLLLGEAFMLEKILGVTWGEMDPLGSAEHATALFRVLLVSREGLPEDEAKERVEALTVKQVLASITRYSEVEPPKD